MDPYETNVMFFMTKNINIIDITSVGALKILNRLITRRRNRDEIRLKRRLLTREYLLRLNRNLCDGCGLCAENCPREAINWNPPIVIDGCLTRKPAIDFDADSCIFCGVCATICPLDALSMEIDAEKIATIVKNKAFPVLSKEIKITKEKCKPGCEFICQQECPTGAIKCIYEKSGKETDTIDVQIDESLCIYCKRCEWSCPFDALSVKKPFLGKVEFNIDLCPEGCRACVDICPANAVQLDDNGKPKVSRNFCIFCFACQKVCPKEAIHVSRYWVFHDDVTSAIWLMTLEKLTSAATVYKEVASKSGKRKVSRVTQRKFL